MSVKNTCFSLSENILNHINMVAGHRFYIILLFLIKLLINMYVFGGKLLIKNNKFTPANGLNII